MKYKIGNVEVEAVQFDGYNLTEINSFLYGGAIDNCNKSDYIVKTEQSLFKLSEQDFNNMAVKVKEPKFKVGDVAYYIVKNEDRSFDCDKIEIIEIIDKYTQTYYKSNSYSGIEECYLFTLEEAIEKLEEL